MKKETTLKAKTPAAKRAPKSAPKTDKKATKSEAVARASKTAVASKAAAGASKPAGAKAKPAAAKAKTPKAAAEKTKTATAKTESVEKRAPKTEKPKTVGAKTRKAKTGGAGASRKIGEPVLDPIGDVISGEARTYLGDKESQGKVEMDAYREDTEIAASDGTTEDGTGMAGFGAADASGDDEEEAEGEANEKARPPAKLERLQKILSQAGVASRRHAEEMIVAGRVMVNGQIVTQMGSKADAGRDHIRVDGKLLKGAERHRYFVLNKPKGYVTTVSDPEKRPTVMEFFSKMGERLYPVGRLDYLSEGLLLMTNDGELANLLTKAGSGVEKVYLVKVAGQPTEEELDRLRSGIAIERGEAGSERVRTSPARIRQVRVADNPWYEVVLTEGRNRELRKMFAAIGHFAEKIRRVGYGPLELDVEPGKLRELTLDEVNALRLTAEGKMRPKRMRVELPKEKSRGAGKFGDRPGRGDRPAQPWRAKPAGTRDKPEGGRDRPGGRRFDGGQRGAQGGAAGRGARPFAPSTREGRPFGQREDRGQRTEWKPREGQAGGGESKPFERGQRTGFGGRPERAGGNFGGRSNFGARPKFGGGREGGGQDRGAGRGGERGEWKPREQTAGRSDSGPRKPFRPQGARPAFTRPEGSPKIIIEPQNQFEGTRPPFKGNDEGTKRFEGARPPFNKDAKTGFGGDRGKGFSRGAKPGPKKFGGKPGAKPGGFGKFRGGAGGGKKFGGGNPGAGRGGFKRG
jgi:23S rRNA pseudouridine2605 synthase